MKSALLSLLFLSSAVIFSQNIFINEEWDLTNAAPTDQHREVISALDPNSNLVYLSSHDNGNNSDIFLNCIHPNGAVVWQQVCTSSTTQDDWAADLEIDSNGYIYIAGTFDNGTNQDYYIAKFTQSGSLLWEYFYDYGSIDIAAAITLDGNGDVYVLGTSKANSTMSDFATIKLNGQTGSLIWESRYDYNNKPEIAADITLDLNGNVVVCGASGQSLIDYWYGVVKYDPTNGNELNVKRINSPGLGMDMPAKILVSSSQIIVVGSSNFDQVNSDIKIVAYDQGLNVNWVQYIDQAGVKDICKDAVLLQDGSVNLTGFCTSSGGEQNFITTQYSQSGIQNWMHERYSYEGGSAQGTSITYDQEQNLYVTGYVTTDNEKVYRTASYTSAGNLLWEKTFENASMDGIGSQIVAKDQTVQVTGEFQNTTQAEFRTVTYRFAKKDTSAVFDSDNNPLYMKRDLIVRLDPSAVNISEVDAKKNTFWTLDQILVPSAVSEIQNALSEVCNSPKCEITVYKIFFELTSDLTSTTSRLGEEIPIPEFWATFVFEFPEGVDIVQAYKDLEGTFPLVSYTTPNLIGTTGSIPNDTYYPTEQYNLHPFAGVDSAHINVEPAWVYETGKSFVRVGVFDTGILWPHPDFALNDGSPYNTFVKGWDFETSQDLLGSPSFGDVDGHGTSCAGIIGALRNNSNGISGIAGGHRTTDSTEYGVSLYGLKIINPSYWQSSLNYINDAIVTSAIDDTLEYTYGIHLSSNSWYFHPGFTNQFTDTNITFVREAIHFANRAKVTYVSLAGNFGVAEEIFDTVTQLIPTIIDSTWIISVGGTGTDGWYNDGIGTPGILGGTEFSIYLPSKSWLIDVSAPFSDNVVYTTKPWDGSTYYGGFNGTSASTPHVAGTIALLMSYLNDTTGGSNYNNLAPEDCEWIVERTANDCNYDLYPGLDSLTGYGRVNAGKAIQQVDKNIYSLQHHQTNMNPNSTNINLFSSNDTITIPERYQNDAMTWFLPDAYIVDTYEITSTVTHSLNPTDYIFSAWERHSSSNTLPLFDSDNELIPRERVVLVNYDLNSALLRGYIYKVSDTLGNPLGWWPFDTSSVSINLAYSLLVDTTGVLSTEELPEDSQIQLYPNPSIDYQTLIVQTEEVSSLSVNLVDIEGRLIQQVYTGDSKIGSNQFNLNLAEMSTGVYFVQVILGDETYTLRSVKLH